MIADALSTGHVLLSDWFLVGAVVAFVVALVADVLARPGEPPRGRSTAVYVRPLALVGLALVALALLVL